jgi:hypothetical protein
MEKGMMAFIYRNADGGDCTLNGLSARYSRVVVIGPGIPGLFEPTKDMPALYLHDRGGYMFAAPIKKSTTGRYAMGGNFVSSCDSRFPNKYPIPIHDRDMSLEVR